ncbi:MAG TPA: hypothetical protein VLC98_06050 [Phnomibacter sp.]|nr:hypothetical protein [Phnomibacter sp.]
MKTLSETWFADGYIDFELKKYTLLSYLQQVNQCFNQNKLYPPLADIIFHYNNLLQFRTNKEFLKQQFPKRISQVDWEKLTWLYESMVNNDDMMQELEDIIAYSLRQMKSTIEGGAEVYEFVEGRMEISEVGLLPLDTNEGYFLLRDGRYTDTKVYQYRMMFFEKQSSKYRSIRTEYVYSWKRSVANTCESIKAELLRNRNFMPNPAVYSIETSLSFPLEETLLPVAKRYLARYITDNQRPPAA